MRGLRLGPRLRRRGGDDAGRLDDGDVRKAGAGHVGDGSLIGGLGLGLRLRLGALVRGSGTGGGGDYRLDRGGGIGGGLRLNRGGSAGFRDLEAPTAVGDEAQRAVGGCLAGGGRLTG